MFDVIWWEEGGGDVSLNENHENTCSSIRKTSQGVFECFCVCERESAHGD
jgi:hypothetical protein